MTLLIALLLACTDPAADAPNSKPAAAARAKAKTKAKAKAPDDSVKSSVIPILGFSADEWPKHISGLTPAAAPGEFDIDPDRFTWPGAGLRDGHLRFVDRRLARAVITVAGRADCDALRAQIVQHHGEPSEEVCTTGVWQTKDYGIRYLERPQQAVCTAIVLVDGAFPVLGQDVVAELDTAGVLGDVQMGVERSAVSGLTAIGEPTNEGREQQYARRGYTPRIPGVETYGITWGFFDDRLEALSVRASADSCDRLEAVLTGLYGEGTAAGGSRDRVWQGCSTLVEYRYSDGFLACRATGRSLPDLWKRVEYESGAKDRADATAREAMSAFVQQVDGTIQVGPGVIDWLKADDSRKRLGYKRPRNRTREGKDEGFRVVELDGGSLLYVLGFRSHDLILSINETPALSFAPTPDTDELLVQIRRDGKDETLHLAFAPGVYAKILEIRRFLP